MSQKSINKGISGTDGLAQSEKQMPEISTSAKVSIEEIMQKVGELYLMRDKLIKRNLELEQKIINLEQEKIALKIEIQNLKDAKGENKK